MTIKGSLEEKTGPILQNFNLLRPKRLWREKVFADVFKDPGEQGRKVL